MLTIPTVTSATLNAALSNAKEAEKKRTVQDTASFLSKLLHVGGDFVEFSGKGVERTVTTKNTPTTITIKTKTVLDRAELANKLRELGQGTEGAVKDIEQGLIRVGSQTFTPNDLQSVAALARLFSGRNEQPVIGTEVNKPTEELQPADRKVEDPPIPGATANIQNVAQLIKGNVSEETLETLSVVAKGLSDQELLALIKAVASKDNPTTPPELKPYS